MGYLHVLVKMKNNLTIFNLLNVLVIIIPMLLGVAFMTIIERKQLAAHQRRVGPQVTGYWGVLQPFADALKLILKENVVPTHANKVLFFVAPIATLILSFLGWAIIPFGQGLCLADFNLGILYTLALSSLGVIGILFLVKVTNLNWLFKKEYLAIKLNKDYKTKKISFKKNKFSFYQY
jgi:NADH-ubiquinone oxidoreductase chain 1